MDKIKVVIASSPHDLQADGIKAVIDAIGDWIVVTDRVIALHEVEQTLAQIPADEPCALILVTARDEDFAAESSLLDRRPRLVVLHVEIAGTIVRIGLHDPSMQIVLAHLRELVKRAGRGAPDCVSHLIFPSGATGEPTAESPRTPSRASAETRPALHAAVRWIEAVLRRGGLTLPHGIETAAGSDLQQTDTAAKEDAVAAADAELDETLALANSNAEPLAALVRRLDLTALDLRLILLALAPELDVLYQRCYSDLQGEPGRRVGSLALYAALMGDPVATRQNLTTAANLQRWRLLDTRTAMAQPAADDPLRLDSGIVDWLLGDSSALAQDIRLRRVFRLMPWPGESVIEESIDVQRVAGQLKKLQFSTATNDASSWLLFNGDQTATWHSVLERAGHQLDAPLLRVQASRIAALDPIEVGETAWRLARLARVSDRPIVLDAADLEATADNNEAMRLVLGELGTAKCRAGIICTNVSRFVGLLDASSVEIVPDSCKPEQARLRALKSAAQQLGIPAEESLLGTLEQQVPLQADGWERAMRLTRARSQSSARHEEVTKCFIASCRDVAAESGSSLASRLDPHCTLRDVVLPDEHKGQLWQIVHGVRFARRVLEDWKFGEQLAYGRGVTALFHGPSGTGKTMAALAVAQEIGSQVLRIDLSQVVSKYIGETEKHLDAVFRDATQCGAVLLIDEADALLGKRGEIKDARDRYSVMEVSFLLQRIEQYEGVAIFTTNARQNVDAAFLRRMRFIIEFPKPDMAARELIWRRCLTPASHVLDEADFRQLARRIDMSGGHIRQITLQAAFLAAAADEKVSLKHIGLASRAELAKLGLPPVALEAGAVHKVA